MIPTPSERFLGVPERASARQLLRLPAGPLSRITIETALRDRIDQVYRHPDGRSEEADAVRRWLREAAAALIAAIHNAPPPTPPAPRSPRPAAASGHELTEFDRYVLAILVGCGGWNAESRARLVGLAGSYGVTPSGLSKVVGGLARFARTGGHRLEVADITSGGGRLPVPTPVAPSATVAAGIDPLPILEKVAPEFKSDDLWATIKLSALFGLATLLVGVVVLRVALREAPRSGGVSPTPAVLPTLGERAGTDGPRRDGDPATLTRTLARFQSLPTFRGNAIPLAAADAADDCPELPAILDEVARKLSLTDEPAEPVFRDWTFAVETIAAGWILIDTAGQRGIEEAMIAALHETKDAPSVGDRMLDELTPTPGLLTDPVDLARGAWRSGMLGTIAANTALPASVVVRSQETLGVIIEDGDGPPPFAAAAGRWLDTTVEPLVETLEYQERYEDFWEMWLTVQRRLGDRERMNVAVMGAVEAVLASDVDLARAGPSVNVLGRLLATADFDSSPAVRDAVERLFKDEERIGGHDLWVFTSLLAQSDAAPWFGEKLVLPAEGDAIFRNRIRDLIVRRWPEVVAPLETPAARGRAIVVDPAAVGRWWSLRAQAAALPRVGVESALMERLVIACRLNEVAALVAAQRVHEAEAIMDDVADQLAARETVRPGGPGIALPQNARPTPRRWRRPRGRGAGPVRPGQPLGQDGEWAANYTDLGRKPAERLKWLQALRSTAGTDLGPLDAEVFVREMYRGAPHEIRSLARSLLQERFATGPNVAWEVLDQFPDSPRNEDISETIRRFTGRVLPPARSDDWPSQSRLALVDHLQMLRGGGVDEIDAMADELVDSYARRRSVLLRQTSVTIGPNTPHATIRLLAQAWWERAESSISATPTPDDLAGLTRRRATRRQLAEGSLQSLVADQLSLLDALVYVTVAEQPSVREAALVVLAESSQARHDATHVLTQAILAERAIGDIWALRVAPAPAARGEDRS